MATSPVARTREMYWCPICSTYFSARQLDQYSDIRRHVAMTYGLKVAYHHVYLVQQFDPNNPVDLAYLQHTALEANRRDHEREQGWGQQTVQVPVRGREVPAIVIPQ